MRRRVVVGWAVLALTALHSSPASAVPIPTWTAVASEPSPQVACAFGAIGGKVYVAGGTADFGTPLTSCLEYSPAPTDSWAAMNDMPTAREWPAGGVLNGQLYVVAGYDGAGDVGANESFDPSAGPGGTWTSHAPIPTPRDAPMVAVVNGKLYTIGGYEVALGGVTGVVEEYDPVGDTWTAMTSMPTARELAAITVVNGKIYVIGGDDGGTVLDTVEAFDPSAGPGGTWTTRAAYPTPIDAAAAVEVNGRLWVLGGYDDTFTVVGTVASYDPGLNTWTTSTNLPAPAAYIAAANVGNRIEALGGIDGSFTPSVAGLEGRWAEFNAALAVAPSSGPTGQYVTVSLTVTNAGGEDATGVTPTMGEATGGGLVIPDGGPIPAGPQTIAAGSSMTFSWTLSTTGGGGPVIFSATADGTDVASGLPVSGSAAATLTLIPPATLASRLSFAPANPVPTGTLVTVWLTVTNTGGGNASGVVPTLGEAAGGGLVIPDSGPNPAGPQAIAAGSSVTFSWTFSTTGGGGSVNFSATADGADVVSGQPASGAASGVVTLLPPAALAGSLSFVPSPVPSGSMVTVRLTVTNTGGGNATGVVPTLGEASGGGMVIPNDGPLPAGPQSIAAGANVTFTWTFSTTGGGGPVTFSATVDGTDAVSAQPASGSTASVLTVLPPMAILASGLSIAPAGPVPTGALVTVWLTVSNTGTADANSVAPTLGEAAGAGLLIPDSGPTPAAPQPIPMGTNVTFSWTFSTTGAGGSVRFSATADGTDAISGLPVSGATAATLTLVPPAILSGQLSFTPNPDATGTMVTVQLTVTNTGGATATGVVPTLGEASGGALVIPDSGPIPGTPQTITAGAHVTFSWTFSTTGAGGPVRFSATADGTDAASGLPVQGATAGTLTMLPPAAFLSSILSFAPPNPVQTGTLITVWLTVSNTGLADATGVTPTLGEASGAALVIPDSGPAPGTPQPITAGSNVTFSWTFSTTGGGGPVRFSATADGTDALSGLPVSGATAGTVTLLPPAALSGILSFAPSPAPTGSLVTVWLTVTNTGGGNASGVVPTLGVSSGGALVIADHGPIPAGPQAIAVGANVTFSWTFSTTGAGGPVTFSATANGFDALSAQPVLGATAGVLTMLPPAALSGILSFIPNPTPTGSLVTVRLTVTNTGGGGASGVAPSIEVTSGGALVIADHGPFPAGPQSIAAGANVTFSWTYSTTGAGGPVSFSATADGIDTLSGQPASGSAAGTLTLLPPAALAGILSFSPNPVATGTLVSVSFTVSNTGGASASGISATLVNTSGPGLLLYRTGPVPAGPVVIPAGGMTTFVWTYSANGGSVDNFTATATGIDAASGVPISATAYGTLTALPSSAALVSALAVTPALIGIGQWGLVTLTVTNNGSAAATGVIPSFIVNTGAASATVIGNPSPAGPVTILNGAVRTFTWTLSGSGLGTMTFTVTASGTDAGTGGLALTAQSGSIGVALPATLVSTVRRVPPTGTVYVGQSFDVELTITNSGGLMATNVTPVIVQTGGTGTVVPVSAPAPMDLAPSSATTLVWTFDAAGNGPVTATVFATAWNGVSTTLLTGSSTWVIILRPGTLSATLQTLPIGQVESGLPLKVYLTVSNTGQVPVTGITPKLAPDAGIASLTPVSGPLPPGPLTLGPGGSQRFTWNYTAAAAGPVELSATVTGFDTGLGIPISSTLLGDVTVAGPAALLSTWNLLSTTVDQGASFTERLTVSNTGDVDAWNVTPPTVVVISPSWGATQTGGPSPATRLILAPGASVNFTYTFKGTATGFIDFSATVAGQDSGTLAAIIGPPAASSTVAVVGAAVLTSVAVVVPGGVLTPGAPFTVRFTVTNGGSEDANLAVLSLVLSDPTLARLDAAPVSATFLAAGTSASYVWNYTALAGGTLSLTVSFSATNAGNGKKVSTTKTVAVTIQGHPDGEIAVYPNPAASDTVHVFLHLDTDATGVTVDVYDASMRRVYAGTWTAVSALDGTLDIAGLRNWAPGIYLVRAVATFASGPPRVFPVTKLKVKP